VARITEGHGSAALPSGRVSLSLSHRPQPPGTSNMSREQYLAGVAAAQVPPSTCSTALSWSSLSCASGGPGSCRLLAIMCMAARLQL
jgi:hypothetical protein